MKKLSIVLIVISLLAMVGCAKNTSTQTTTAGSKTALSKKISVVYGHGFAPGSPQALAAEEFKTRIETACPQMSVEVFPSGQLGSAQEMFESVQMGSQQIALLPTARISGFNSSLQIFDLPFLFNDKETAYKMFDGEVGANILKTLEKNGVYGLAIYEDGFKHFTANSPLTGISSFKGKKFRTMESPIIMEQFKALGANPTPVDFSELYTALQQGTVDGQENPLVTIDSVKLYEVQKYLLLSSHAYLGHVFIVNKAWYDSLSADEKKEVNTIAKEVASWERALVAEKETGFLETIKNAGVTVNSLSEAERAKMEEAVAGVYKVAENIVGKDLLDSVLTALGKN